MDTLQRDLLKNYRERRQYSERKLEVLLHEVRQRENLKVCEAEIAKQSQYSSQTLDSQGMPWTERYRSVDWLDRYKEYCLLDQRSYLIHTQEDSRVQDSWILGIQWMFHWQWERHYLL